MKKLLFTFMLAFLTNIIIAQTEWAPLGAKWTYSYVNSPFHLQSIGDTIINGHNCKTIKVADWNSYYYTYKDNFNRVFYWNFDQNQFHLVYDFSKGQGESWVCTDPVSNYSFTVTVDSVRNIIIDQDTLKVQYISNDGFAYSLGPYVIENIGSCWYQLPTNLSLDPPILPLRCYSDDLIEYHAEGYNSTSCDSVINDIFDNVDITKDYTIYPNPLTNQLFWIKDVSQNNTFSELTIDLFDVYGRVVWSITVNDLQSAISINQLAKGIYFYKISNKGKQKGAGKIVVLSPD